MPKSEMLRRMDEQSSLLFDRDVHDPTETTTPPVPEGITVRAVQDGILINVDFNIDMAHMHPRFQAFIVYTKPVDSEVTDDSGAEVGRFSDSDWVWQQDEGGYTGWLIALSAITNTGYESDKTDWYYCVLSTVYDNFSNYGGDTITDVSSLYWLRVDQFDAQENTTGSLYGTWLAVNNADIDVNTTAGEYVEGPAGIKVTDDGTGIKKLLTGRPIDMSADGRFTDADYIIIAYYVNTSSGSANGRYDFIDNQSGTLARFYKSGLSTTTGWHYSIVKRSDLSQSDSPNWNSIDQLEVEDDNTGVITWDAWYIVKADPDDANSPNPTGRFWDFNDGTWLILEADRDGEPGGAETYTHTLGQIENAAGDYFFATRTDTEIPNGRVSAGVHFKGEDGRAGVTFRVDDDTLGSEDAFAVEIASGADQVNLMRFTGGSSANLATATFSAVPNTTYWLGVDFRDPDNENRIKVYVSTLQYELFTADALVISYATTAPWPDGKAVGLLSKQSNCRFIEFHAGSPQVADYARVAGYALVTKTALAGGVDHGGCTGLSDDDHTQYFLLSGETADANLESGADLILFSDGGSTEVGRWDGATGNIQLSNTDGVDVNPGSDTNADLITVGVTDSPTLSWDETGDTFDFSKGLGVTGNIEVSGTVDGVDVGDFKTTYDAHDHSTSDPTQVDHANLTNVTSDQHHAQAHDIEGADHTAAGLTTGHVMRATGATTFAFGAIQSGDLPSVDHGGLGGLTDDDHSQYPLSAGRSGGQSVNGGTDSGDDLTLNSTSHATKGYVLLNTGGGNVGIGTATPDSTVEISATTPVLKIASTTDGNDVAMILERIGNTRIDWRFLNNGGDLKYQTSDDEGSTWTDRVLFGGSTTYAGRVGIGTTTPAQVLDVVGNIAVSGTVDGVDVSAQDAKLLQGRTLASTAPSTGELLGWDGSQWEPVSKSAGYSGAASGFRVYKSSTQTVSDSTWTLLTWQTTEFDDTGGVDLANNRWTAPADGVVYLYARMNYSAEPQLHYIRITKNSSAIANYELGSMSDSDTHSIQVAVGDACTTGDDYEVYVEQESGSARTCQDTAARTQFGGIYIKD